MSGFPIAQGLLAPEAEICLAALAVDRSAGLARVRALAGESLDESRLLNVARKNRVTTALGLALEEAGVARRLPRITEDARTLDRRGALFTAELGGLLHMAETQGIEMLPYKGPALAAQLYDDPRERMFKDIDVLVRPEAVTPFARSLAARGYVSEDRIDDAAMARRLSRDCELHLRHSATGLLLELHWHVMPGRHGASVDMEGIWQRARVPIQVAGIPSRGFELEDLLVLVALHGGVKHRWMRLQVVADIARLALVSSLNWDLGLERARGMDCEAVVLEGAFLAWCTLGAPLPERILERAAQGPAGWDRAAVAIYNWFGPGFGLPSYPQWRKLRDALGRGTSGRCATAPAPGRFSGYLRLALAPSLADRPTWLPGWLNHLGFLTRSARMVLRHRGGLAKRVLRG